MLIKVKATGIKEAERRLQKNLRPTISRGINRAGTILLRAARQEVPKKTRQLERSLAVIATSQTSFALVEGAIQGVFIREGTIGHSIFPKKVKALWWPGLSHPVRWVAHPGIRHKNDYPDRALSRAQGPMSEALDITGVELATELGGG